MGKLKALPPGAYWVDFTDTKYVRHLVGPFDPGTAVRYAIERRQTGSINVWLRHETGATYTPRSRP